ncbi:MAG: hypothetical protein DVB25_05310 [Verrucomicrobia bacterium]|nr:MAG: hypothetical protein DVB25_05310 [Verrucomicrobiota bacterium]
MRRKFGISRTLGRFGDRPSNQMREKPPIKRQRN